ncbi:lipocalin/fatty-acid binding family protein [Nocardia sp. NPDC060256]|uniref:lipocalin/fatty-acid binding family protein n=1 Tax=unclassified Nocardia TaxID=2637762 RepID=UPI003665D194
MGSPAFYDFSGIYEVASSDKYEEYLDAIDADATTRAAASAQLKIKQEGDHYTLTTSTPTGTTVSQFTLGQEYVESDDQGRSIKGICRRDGNRIIQQLKRDKVEMTVVRTLDGETLTAVFHSGNTTANRSYRRLA